MKPLNARLILSLAFFAFAPAGILSQVSPFVPHFKAKSGIITYGISFPGAPDPSTHPMVRISFDEYGEYQTKEYIDEIGVLMNNGPTREIFIRDEFFRLESGGRIAQKFRLTDSSYYMDGMDEGFIKLAQDLLQGKGRKYYTTNITSFKKTGSDTILGHPCQVYEVRLEDRTDRIELMLYNDICLARKYFAQDELYCVFEATSYSENVPVPASVFEIPADFKTIDYDLLEAVNEDIPYPYSSVVVEYTSLSSVGETKQEGKKILYIGDDGKTSCEEFTGTFSAFGLPPDKIHIKIIRSGEWEHTVDFIKRTVRRRGLFNTGMDDKSIPTRNYLFSNELYDNSWKLTGKTNFLGRDCRILQYRKMSEKLEVYEWNGIYLKLRKFVCYDDECSEPVLLLEENATRINVNIPIEKSLFEYPEDYEIIVE